MANGPVFWAPPYHRSDLENSPSRPLISYKQELKLRNNSVQYIFRAAKLLKFPYQAIASACVYLHHYYMNYPFCEKQKYSVCHACLFLSSKAEECRKSLRDIIKAQFLLRRVQVPDRASDTYMILHDSAAIAESKLLQALDFGFIVNHPYQFLREAFETLFSSSLKEGDSDRKLIKRLTQTAWWFASDSFRSVVCLFYPPQHVALAAVDLAVRFHNCVALAEGERQNAIRFSGGWWNQFDLEMPETLLESICAQILEVYSDKDKRVAKDVLSTCSASKLPQITPQKKIVSAKEETIPVVSKAGGLNTRYRGGNRFGFNVSAPKRMKTEFDAPRGRFHAAPAFRRFNAPMDYLGRKNNFYYGNRPPMARPMAPPRLRPEPRFYRGLRGVARFPNEWNRNY